MIYRTIRIVPALILLQSLFFKFTAHPEAVALFTKIGMEPQGRIGIGIVELIVGIGLLIPGYSKRAALIGIVLMLGAVYYHITVLGYDLLFGMALVVLLCCIIIAYKSFI